MKIKVVLEEIEHRKGQFVPCVWKRRLKTRKGVTNLCEKLTESIIKTGIDFSRLRAVQEARESAGVEADPHHLVWGEWSKFPFVITHKGEDFLRIYPADSTVRAKVQYFIDGEEVLADVIKPLCLASEFRENAHSQCFTIRAENILRIGNVVDSSKVKIEY